MATELTKVVFPTTDYIDLNKYRLLTNNDFDTINVTELNAGDVIVTGAARFLNTINGDISGNAETATSATKATQDESGNNIKNTYASSFSISDHTITLKNKNGTSLGTVTVPDNNTTYTVATGTANGKIKVTPSSGSAYEVSVYGLKSAAYKDVTDSYSATGTDPVSGKAVAAALDSLPEPMVFRGSLGTGGTITALPVDGTAKVGDTYKVITAGTYASKAAKVGDTFICLTKTDSANTWELIPSGDEPSGTVTSVAISNGGGLSVSGSPITSSGTITISHADTSSQASVDNSGRTYIQDISLDTYGHVTKITSATETVVNTDRYVNSAAFADATSADANNPIKMTLTRAGSDTASVTAYLPKISSSSAGVAPKGAAVSSQSQSTKFLREDGTWAVPSYTTDTNTTYTIGTSGNTVTLTPSSGSVQSITVPYATSANSANYVSLIANNEIRLAGKPSTAQTIFMGYKWSDNTSAALINRWKFCNGNGASAEVEASTFYGALSGNATSATTASKLGSANVGSATQPIYLSAGTATACTYTLGKSVPSDADFNNTKNTAGSTDTSSKIFLIGATSQAANPQTYSQDTAYVGTDGCLYSGGVKVLTSHQDISGKVSKTGDIMSGALTVEASNSYSSYNEGIRINAGARTYATLLMGGTNGTTSGTNDGAFWLGVYNTGTTARRLMIAHNGSTNTGTYFYASSSSDISPSLRVGSNLQVANVISANVSNSGTAGGISLYSTDPASYGIAMRNTTNSGKHGYVQGDWGTYFYMAGATNRGWVFCNAGSGNRMSISNEGHIVTNGSLTLGGNTTNTSGVRQVYNSTTKSLDFVFVA